MLGNLPWSPTSHSLHQTPAPLLELRDPCDPLLTGPHHRGFPSRREQPEAWLSPGTQPAQSKESTWLSHSHYNCIHPPDSNLASESSWRLALPACEIPHRCVLVNFINLSSDCQSESPTLMENLLCQLKRDRGTGRGKRR